MEKYFIIRATCDGIYLECLKKDQLLERLDEKYYGDAEITENLEGSIDLNEEERFIIIKGDIAVPFPKKIVEKYDL